MIDEAHLAEIEHKLALQSPQLARGVPPRRVRAAACALRMPTSAPGPMKASISPRTRCAPGRRRSTTSASPARCCASCPRRPSGDWAHAGRDLAEYSSVVAGSFFRASPESMPYLDEHSLIEWATLGQRLYKGHWKSISLATVYFSASPGMLPSLTLGEMARLVALVECRRRALVRAGDRLPRCGAEPLRVAREADRAPFLTLATAVGEASWADVRICFERSPNLLAPIEPSARSRFLALAPNVARRSGRHAYALFSEGAAALATVPQGRHHDLLSMAEELSAASPDGGDGVPQVARRKC